MYVKLGAQEMGFLSQFITESERIERMESSEHINLEEIRERKEDGHVGAFLFLISKAQNGEILQEDDFFRVQRLIVEEQPLKGQRSLAEKYCGAYRDRPVCVGADKGIDPEHVKLAMADFQLRLSQFLGNYKEYAPQKRIIAIANFHYEFLKLHPFADGNGRTARALAYYSFLLTELTPFIFDFKDEDMKLYFDACAQDLGIYRLMHSYFLGRASPEDLLLD